MLFFLRCSHNVIKWMLFATHWYNCCLIIIYRCYTRDDKLGNRASPWGRPQQSSISVREDSTIVHLREGGLDNRPSPWGRTQLSSISVRADSTIVHLREGGLDNRPSPWGQTRQSSISVRADSAIVYIREGGLDPLVSPCGRTRQSSISVRADSAIVNLREGGLVNRQSPWGRIRHSSISVRAGSLACFLYKSRIELLTGEDAFSWISISPTVWWRVTPRTEVNVIPNTMDGGLLFCQSNMCQASVDYNDVSAQLREHYEM
jgi:hypothetical protein